MKRWLGVLAIALLFCGCSNAAPQEKVDNATLPTIQAPSFVTPSLYDPENPIEGATGGAVKAYSLEDRTCTGIIQMGKRILLTEENGMLLLRSEKLTEVEIAKIDGLPMPDSGMLQIQEDGVAYYDAKTNKVVFLNNLLREVGVFSLPEGVVGGVYLAPDWKMVYYCTQAGVHILDLDTGIARVLKAQSAQWQGISGGFAGGEVLRCHILQEDGTEQTMLISAQNGTILAEGDYLNSMRGGDGYYLQIEGRHVFGFLKEQTQTLSIDGEGTLYPIPNSRGAVNLTQLEDGCLLDYYDLESGKHTASEVLVGIKEVNDIFGAGGMIWILCGDTLYRWEIEESGIEDAKIYVTPYYHHADPDEQGLSAVGQQLQQLEAEYGVEILYWNETEALAPWNYQFIPEFLTEPYAAHLDQLEQALEKLPAGFLQKAAQWTTSGKLNIVLVRGIYGGVETEKYASASGIQFHANGDAYIALTLGEDLDEWFYHEVGHLIDNRILSTTNAYSQWNSLNPWDFKYDNDYIKNQDRTDRKYLEGEKRHFVDFYSMSFALEDRSRIFEYACMPGNEEIFESKPMQKKLKCICDGIREAFELTGESYIWEQYLKT